MISLPRTPDARLSTFFIAMIVLAAVFAVMTSADLTGVELRESSLSFVQRSQGLDIILTSNNVDDGQISYVHLVDENGELYVLSVAKTSSNTWLAHTPFIPDRAHVSFFNADVLLASEVFEIGEVIYEQSLDHHLDETSQKELDSETQINNSTPTQNNNTSSEQNKTGFFVFKGGHETFFTLNSYESAEHYIEVQRDVVSSSTALTDITIEAVNLANTFVLSNVRSTSSAPSTLQVTTGFLDNQTLRIERYATTSAEISYEVVTSSLFAVQREETIYSSSDSSIDVSIEEVDLNSSFIILNARLNTATANQFNRGLWTATFLNSTTIRLERSITGTEGVISWQVVSIQGSKVQRGSSSTTLTSVTENLDRAVELDKTLTILSQRTDATGLAHYSVGAQYLNASQLQLSRNTASGTLDVEWFVIEHPFFEVQRDTVTVSGITAINEVITTVNLSRSFHSRTHTTTGTGTVNANTFFTSELTTSNQLQFLKGTNSQTQTVIYEVVEFNINSTPPRITVHYPTSGYQSTSPFPLVVNISTDKESDLVFYSVNDWQTNISLDTSDGFNFNASITSLDDGDYTLRLFAQDTYGYINNTETVEFSIDTTPPSITIHSPQAQVYGSATNLIINVSVSDIGIGLDSCSWKINSEDIEPILCTETALFNASEGLNTFTYYANDSLGNNANMSVEFSVVSGVPVVVLESPSDEQWLNSKNPTTFEYHVSYENTITSCSLFGNWSGIYEAVAVNTSIINDSTNSFTRDLSSASDGEYVWNVMCNGSSQGAYAFANYTHYFDTLKPVVSWHSSTLADQSVVDQNYIYAEIELEELNVQSITYELYDNVGLLETTTYFTETLSHNWTELSKVNDEYWYNVTVNDQAGNKNTTPTRKVTLIDTTPPIVSISYPNPTTYYQAVTELAFTASDDQELLECWYSTDEGLSNITTNCTETITGLESVEGLNTWTVWVNDTSSNEGYASVTFTVDTSPPPVIVQRGRTSVAGTQNSVLIPLDNPAPKNQTYALAWVSTASGTPQEFTFTTELVNNSNATATHLNITRHSSGSLDWDVSYMIVSAWNVFVQHASVAMSTGVASTTDTLQEAVNTSASWVITHTMCESGTCSTANMNQVFTRANLTNNNTVQFNRAVSTNAATITSYQVVEFTDTTKVQNTQISMSSGTSATTSVEEVNLSRSFLYHSYSSEVSGMSYSTNYVAFTNSTEVGIYRQDPSTSAVVAQIYVIEFPEKTDALVQSKLVSTSATGDSYLTDTINTPVDLERAYLVYGQYAAAGTGAGTAYPRPFWTNSLSTSTLIEWWRGYTGQQTSIQWFVVEHPSPDKTPPTVNITMNTSTIEYGIETINITWLASDDVALDRVIFNITSPDQSVLYETTAAIGELILTPSNLTHIGTYEVTLWVNDTSSNMNSTSTSFEVDDTTDPAFSNVIASPASPTTYEFGQSYAFNVTWTDTSGIKNATIEHNFTLPVSQHIMTNNTPSQFTYSIFDLAAGRYYYQFRAYDTAGNLGVAPPYVYIVSKADPEVVLLLNGSASNLTIAEDEYFTINVSLSALGAQGLTITLLKDDEFFMSAAANYSTSTFFATQGMHNITALVEASANHSASSITFWVNVTEEIVPDFEGNESDVQGNAENITVYVDGVALNVSEDYGGEVNITMYTDEQPIISFTHDFDTTTLNFTSIELYTYPDSSVAARVPGQEDITLFVPLNGTACEVIICEGVITDGECDDLNTRYAYPEPQEGFCPVLINGTYAKDRPDLTDFEVTESDIVFLDNTPIEGTNVTINVTVHNIGQTWAQNVTVLVTNNLTGALLENYTISNFTSLSNVTFQTWIIVEDGPHLIRVVIDPYDEFVEIDEANNEAFVWLNVSAWQTLYGVVNQTLVLGGQQGVFHTWPIAVPSGTLYAYDVDANIDFASLQAMGRTAAGSASSDDFSELDAMLGMSDFSDSVSSRFAQDSSTPKTTSSMLVNGVPLAHIPVINSTITSSFLTGILWDTTTAVGGEFTGTQDVVFVTKINASQTGAYGEYDYELVVPSSLQETAGASRQLYLYVELPR